MLGAAILLTLGAARLQATPLIFAQPTNANAFVGDASASFKVLATGDASLSYQWQMQPGSSGGFSNVSGATASTLNLSSPTLTMNNYQYRCVLTCSGTSLGTLTSAVAGLKVVAAPTLTPTVTLSTDTIAANNTNDITIHITGLNVGDTVRIQRVLDADGSGTADPGEPLVQSVQVTDGVVSSIGGVTNTSVPHDEDGAANGSITTHFSLPSATEMGRTAGSYLIRVSSPTGGFRPVQKTLTVTQPAYGQSISGQVLAGTTPVPYAGVVLITNSSNGNYVASALANASGNYTINAPVGNYIVLPTQLGYVGQMGTLTVSLGAGQTLTGRNPALTAATCTISGQVQDASTTSSLKGVQLMFGSNSNYFSLATSDINGNYVVSALPDGWGGQPSDLSMAALGYTSPSGKTQVTTTSGNVTSQNLLYSPATALLSGTVRNSAAAVMPGVTLSASQSSGSDFRTVTDANGNFTVGVSSGTWHVQLDSGYASSNNFVGSNLQVSVTSGQGISGLAIQIANATGTISGYVHNAVGAGVSTSVSASASINGTNYYCGADTDSSGSYSFPVINGLWNVNVSQSGYAQQNVQVSGSAVINFTPPPVVAHLQGTVTNNGAVVSGASIGASFQGSGNTWISTTTDSSGNFDIGVTSNGTWNIQLESNYADSNSLIGPSIQEIVSNGLSISGIAVHILTGTGTVSGYVHNAGGTGVATGVYANSMINGTNYFGYTNTDGFGNYSLPVINGLWNVNVSQSGYTQQNVQISGSAVVNFTPTPVVAHLQGTVTRSGTALAGATIGATNNSTWISTVTDASGYFDISVSANGTWYLRLDSSYADANYLVGPNLTQIVSNNQSISNISYPVVGASYLISGVVQDTNGLPVTTQVIATTTLYGVNYYAQANTDSNGLYILPAIDGAWTVWPTMNGYSQQIVNVTGVNFTGASPFQQWRQTYFSTVQLTHAGLSGISAPVLSGAGYTNEIAYALGLDPRTAKASDLPALGKAAVASLSYLTLSFNRNISATDLTYQVQVSNDLGNWIPLSTYSAGAWSPSNIVSETTTGNVNLKHVQVRDTVPLSLTNKRFLRLVAIHS